MQPDPKDRRGALAKLAGRLDALNEFEREPVAPEKLQSGRHFAAIFGGEHVAGTEFVIGSLFVLWGVEAGELIAGLIAGNILAVLSWTFVCAPIATRVRLTLYWYLRRIAGPGFAVLYSLANGLLFCFLAGAMIALCADAASTALEKVGLRFVHPTLSDRYPSNAAWVLLVLACGSAVTTIAILGFEKMARFASAAVPWMFSIFVAGALATLPKLGVEGIGDLPRIASERIWTGEPIPGLPRLGFWHVASFAWFCNLCTHIDLSDMALFRYAPHWGYGLYSAIGMFMGHFIAWIASGIMCAPLREAIIRDRGLPIGGMAYGAVGIAGLLCVLLASWTTANPTLYRAGLALQIATPRWPRWKVTLAAGLLTSAAACFPFFVMRLLDFVAVFGLVLMPVGAIVFAEHWIFPRIGLPSFWAERRGLFVNPAALIAWAGSLLFCFLLLGEGLGIHLYFLWPPGYIAALLAYTGLAALFGARKEARAAGEGGHCARGSAPRPAPSTAAPPVPAWRRILRAIAIAAIATIAGAGAARLAGVLSEEGFLAAVNAATAAWLAAALPSLAPRGAGRRDPK